ncbi:MAG: TIM barrel protein, partial [Caldilineaceae bacterium]
MPLHFAPNLSMLYYEVPFLDRFERAAKAGFRLVEFLFPYEFSPQEIRSRLDTFGLQAVLFNINPGDMSKGERGSMGDPDQRSFFRQSFEQALHYATSLSVPRIHMMIGNRNPNYNDEAQIDCALENLAWAAPQAAQAHVNLLIEPLNATDMPGYLIRTNADGMRIVNGANQPNVKLQFDVYHTQMTSGNLINAL